MSRLKWVKLQILQEVNFKTHLSRLDSVGRFPKGSKSFPFRIDHYSERSQNNSDRDASLESISVLKIGQKIQEVGVVVKMSMNEDSK